MAGGSPALLHGHADHWISRCGTDNADVVDVPILVYIPWYYLGYGCVDLVVRPSPLPAKSDGTARAEATVNRPRNLFGEVSEISEGLAVPSRPELAAYAIGLLRFVVHAPWFRSSSHRWV